jgi:hypothetical protein
MTALSELIKAVERGDWGPETKALRSFPSSFRADEWAAPMDRRMRLAWGAYHGSLDAALALHEAVLPGWEWCMDSRGNADLSHGVSRPVTGRALYNPARAWLLAILKALATTTEGQV